MSKSVTRGEPALTTGTITAVVAAAVTLLVAFGLDLSSDQVIAITAFVAVIAPLVSSVITRRQVIPSVEVAAQVAPDGSFVAGDALSTVETGKPVEVV